ncbi:MULTISPECIES: hypothetical protein [unclassified Gluconobacter]|nr:MULTISPECIES: hypothetical protein [unclassified Gluconobacter]GFE95584.1 hypothetical protein DmGdi_06570 [Gluconobacter sp. Gdi]
MPLQASLTCRSILMFDLSSVGAGLTPQPPALMCVPDIASPGLKP